MKSILHCDLNNFFASCEILNNPSLKDKPVAVGGNEEDRRGVVLAKNYLAKAKGIYTGQTCYQAKKLCPELVLVEPNFKLYNHYSKLVRDIYLEYSDRVEPFSIDECFIDVTHSKIFGTPEFIANEIKERVKNEIGLTISVGVSFNKIFAKLGSDLKKPDAVTIITKENFKKIIWNLPIDDMMGIGNQTKSKLLKIGIDTIGKLANADRTLLEGLMGKIGTDLHNYANGIDESEVEVYDKIYIPKSVGNSTTFYKDLHTKNEIELGFTVLAENVCERMIKYNLQKARTLQITVKDSAMKVIQRQMKLPCPCRDSLIFSKCACELFDKYFKVLPFVRLLGITVTDFVDEYEMQGSFFDNLESISKNADLDKLVLSLREKYGHSSIGKANKLFDDKIAQTFDEEHLKKRD